MRTALLIAVIAAAGAATGCGAGQARPPENPLPPLSADAPSPAAKVEATTPVKLTAPPRL